MDNFFLLERLVRHLKQDPTHLPEAVVAGFVLIMLAVAVVVKFHKFFVFVLKSLRRNVLRTALTSLAIMVLVFVVTLAWTMLVFLDLITSEKSKDLKAIVTEKHQIPSQMPFAYASRLTTETQQLPTALRPGEQDLMTWQFYGGTLDPQKRTRENMIFFFAMDPYKLRSMMDEMQDLDPALEKKLANTRNGALLGRQRLQAINKQIGERFTVASMNYQGIDLEFEIVGVLPEGRYDMNAIMNRDYLNAALDDYQRKKGVPHPLAEKSLNLFWMRLPTTEAFGMMAEQVNAPGKFDSPAVKIETFSSGIAAWLDGYRDLVWGMRWLLTPAILATMTLVVANAISIGVRERQTEMAVLKVLGYRPGQIMAFVLVEALLIGGGSGFLSGLLTYLLIEVGMGGIPFRLGFFPVINVYIDALWWGLLVGALTALAGSIGPAWSARSVKVSEVFSKIT
ncbi:MAG: ABC transporter permease [Gemmataceae bacterium]